MRFTQQHALYPSIAALLTLPLTPRSCCSTPLSCSPPSPPASPSGVAVVEAHLVAWASDAQHALTLALDQAAAAAAAIRSPPQPPSPPPSSPPPPAPPLPSPPPPNPPSPPARPTINLFRGWSTGEWLVSVRKYLAGWVDETQTLAQEASTTVATWLDSRLGISAMHATMHATLPSWVIPLSLNVMFLTWMSVCLRAK